MPIFGLVEGRDLLGTQLTGIGAARGELATVRSDLPAVGKL